MTKTPDADGYRRLSPGVDLVLDAQAELARDLKGSGITPEGGSGGTPPTRARRG